MTKLKPCPFCGRKAAERDIKVPGGNGWIGCQSCRCFIDFVKNGKPKATAAWNRRADDERLKNALKEIVQLACESVEREKALARLEAEVMTAIDAVPVVRGEWILQSENKHDYETSLEEKCSLCGRYVYRYDTQPQDNYCPNCGEKMESEAR